MEHIVQFGINIDDESIKKAIENNVMKQVAESIKQDVMKRLVGKNKCSDYEYTITLDEIIKSVVNEFLDVNRDKIIEETSKKLVDRLAKTKVVKDMVNSTINSLLSE